MLTANKGPEIEQMLHEVVSRIDSKKKIVDICSGDPGAGVSIRMNGELHYDKMDNCCWWVSTETCTFKFFTKKSLRSVRLFS